MNTIGNKIRNLRKQLRMTQDELAGSNISKSYISHIELGKVKPSISTLEYIARKLNKPIAFFLQDDNAEGIKEDYKSLLQHGEELVNKYDYYSGLSLFNSLLESKDKLSLFDLGIVWYYVGFCTFKTKSTQDANKYILKSIDCFDRLLNDFDYEYSKQLQKIYIKQAENHYILNNKKLALDYFLRAKKNRDLQPSDKGEYIYILRNISILHIHFGAFQVAINYLSELIDISKKENLINTNIISTYINLGTCYYYLGKYDKSLDVLTKLFPLFDFLDSSKQLCTVIIKNARALIKLEKYTEAQAYLRDFSNISKNIVEHDIRMYSDLQYELLICEIEFLINKDLETINCVKKIIDTINSLNRDDVQFNSILATAYILLGKIYASNDTPIKSKAVLKEAIAILEENEIYAQLPDAHKLLAKTFIMLGDPENAQFHYEKAIDILTNKVF